MIRRVVVLSVFAICVQIAHANTLKLALIERADDERRSNARVEINYLGHPGGGLQDGVTVAVDENQFSLDAAKLQVKVEAHTANDAASAKALLDKLVNAGVHAALVSLPSAWLSGFTAQSKIALINVGEPEDELRGARCAPNLFHVMPSERMRADALGQWLTQQRWQKVLLLEGQSPEDVTRAAAVRAAIKRYQLKLVASKPFKLSGDPRERELANLALLTGNADYDVVWIVDSNGEFARTAPYRTALPRPVIGDAGLTALAWASGFERFGAPQLSRRFLKANKRPMRAHDWAAWLGAKTVMEAALLQPTSVNAATLLKNLKANTFAVDGFKGVRLSFRAWDRQLRQPMLLTDGMGVIGTAPLDGIMHPKNALDTLGADEAEKLCKAS
jgi:ABC transporter substrate binding protein (PQQ-dependent alcohol dehydrogenase system)